MSARRSILFVAYPGFELLDLSGPLAVFGAANQLAAVPPYDLAVASMHGGPVTDGLGLALQTNPCPAAIGAETTVIVLGALDGELRRAMGDARLIEWLARVAPCAERVCSVCTGAFVLAAAGVLDGRRATTHWMGCGHLGRAFPSVRVEPDALYVQDGRVWTSAGVAAGIDMALAMVRADTDAALMARVARRLVVYAHRPGGQSQFSEALSAQAAAGGAFGPLVEWIERHLAEDLSVRRLAERAGMSERSFHRKFLAVTGGTPSRFVDELRMARARGLLGAGMAIKDAARRTGFASESGFRAAFRERYGVPPATHRSLHGATR